MMVSVMPTQKYIIKMFKKTDFKKLQVLGSGKKNTKIYKAVHLDTGKLYALKEIEAKNLEKLNQYKQQAVQLMKVQNHPNIIKFYGYYFSQTKYNSFKLGIITEYMDQKTNLQFVYRKRKKANIFWTQAQLVTMYSSMVTTCSFLQARGICHRDIKPANIFLLPNNQLKLIDFGQSKDYFYDPNDEDRQTFTMATIRGTPQYLSPILWKAHVIDGSSRFAQHNIYKSDVFSAGLVLIQLALMNEVTGFNSKTPEVNGEKLIKENLKILEKLYSASFSQLFGVLLRFEESDRPSFCEIESLFLQKEQSCRQQNKPCNQHIVLYNKHFSNLTKSQNPDPSGTTNTLKSTFPLPSPQQEQPSPTTTHANQNQNQNQNNKKAPLINIMDDEDQMDTKPKNNYYKDSTLMLHQSCYWFQFGGSSIGRFSISRQKWKVDSGNQEVKFPLHFLVVFVPVGNLYFLLGGPAGQNFRIFQSGKKLVYSKNQMPSMRDFFSAVYHSQKVYIFGGYDSESKLQLRTCEYYDIVTSKWQTISDMKIPRSQSGACRINDDEILVCGGYNKEKGTLDTIERYILSKDRFQVLGIRLPIPLRRFMLIRVAKNIGLVLGGLTVASKESQRVFRLDYEKMNFVELENLEKGGVIENEVLIDKEGNIHLFLEHSNGTSPHSHIKYPYDPTRQQNYETKLL